MRKVLAHNVVNQWLLLTQKIMRSPEYLCAPRGMEIRELLAHTSVVDMSQPAICLEERKINYAFLFGEAAWILSGSNRASGIVPYMKNIAAFSDDGIMFRGAYGPKIVEQLDYVVDALNIDPDTRQAVLTIWRENPRKSKDIPCTVALQFIMRDNELHCIASMRSSDAFLGWVYDVFNFSIISLWVLIAIRAKYPFARLGLLHLTAGSQHLYAKDFIAVDSILDKPSHCLTELCNYELDVERFDHPDAMLSMLTHIANDAKAAPFVLPASFNNMFKKTKV